MVHSQSTTVNRKYQCSISYLRMLNIGPGFASKLALMSQHMLVGALNLKIDSVCMVSFETVKLKHSTGERRNTV